MDSKPKLLVSENPFSTFNQAARSPSPVNNPFVSEPPKDSRRNSNPFVKQQDLEKNSLAELFKNSSAAQSASPQQASAKYAIHEENDSESLSSVAEIGELPNVDISEDEIKSIVSNSQSISPAKDFAQRLSISINKSNNPSLNASLIVPPATSFLNDEKIRDLQAKLAVAENTIKDLNSQIINLSEEKDQSEKEKYDLQKDFKDELERVQRNYEIQLEQSAKSQTDSEAKLKSQLKELALEYETKISVMKDSFAKEVQFEKLIPRCKQRWQAMMQ